MRRSATWRKRRTIKNGFMLYYDAIMLSYESISSERILPSINSFYVGIADAVNNSSCVSNDTFRFFASHLTSRTFAYVEIRAGPAWIVLKLYHQYTTIKETKICNTKDSKLKLFTKGMQPTCEQPSKYGGSCESWDHRNLFLFDTVATVVERKAYNSMGVESKVPIVYCHCTVINTCFVRRDTAVIDFRLCQLSPLLLVSSDNL